ALAQLKKLPKFLAKRKKNFSLLFDFFTKHSEYFILPKQTPKTETAWLAFPLIIKPNAPFTRLQLVTFLENNNIQTRPIFTGNILKQPAFLNIHRKETKSDFPNTEQIMRNGFVVACHHGLNDDQINYLEEKFTEFLSKIKICD